MTIGFIGAGNMATALAQAIAASHSEYSFCASDVLPESLERFGSGLSAFEPQATNADVVRASDVVFLAVKPQVMDSILGDLSSADCLVVSIAAGVRLGHLEEALPSARLVRVMPNTPGLVGEMAAGYAGGKRATADDLALVGRLLESAGVAVGVPEEQLDAVTGLSGSGPAFVARLLEAFVEAGIAQGLEAETARKLALATFSGTARLLAERGMSPEELVTMVSSPGGTTIAGRKVLEASDYREVISATIAAAADRSRELGE